MASSSSSSSKRSTRRDPPKSLEFSNAAADEPPKTENRAENDDLIGKFYKSMVGYAVDRLEPLTPDEATPPPSSVTATYSAIETGRDLQQTEEVRVTYKSGNVYEGHILSGMVPNGQGRLFLRDSGGVTYKGTFKDGLPDGNGVVRWSDGSWYEGEFRKGLRHGRGLHVSAERGRRWYGGQWTDGVRDGRGQTACCGQPDGALNYHGQWADGSPHGHGTGSWPDGTRYTGGWAGGRPHGRGKAVWPGQDVYEGNWVDGHMDGDGVYEWNGDTENSDRLVMCSCDRYTGQWSKSKKHGLGEYFSAETESKVHGSWTDDALDGPCEITISAAGRRPTDSANLVVFREPAPEPVPRTKVGRGSRVPVRVPAGRGPAAPATSVDRGRRGELPAGRRRSLIPVPVSHKKNHTKSTSVEPFRSTCDDSTTTAIARNDDDRQSGKSCKVLEKIGSSESGRSQEWRRRRRADVRSTAGEGIAFDLTGHVCRMAAKCSERAAGVASAVDPELELRAAGCAIENHRARLARLYRDYGAFLARGPVVCRPLLTRLGLWQMLIDSGAHARVSLADFDDLLFENEDCAFESAHDPFEPVYFWQFVHAVCELATFVYDVRQIRREDPHAACCGGLMASALNRLLAEHLKTDVVPVSYAITAGIADDAGGGDSWTGGRNTMATMYHLYRAMSAAAGQSSPPPSARRLIRLYGPTRTTTAAGSRSSLDSVLPAVLDAVLGSAAAPPPPPAAVPGPRTMTLFECSVDAVVALLCEACPRIADARGALIDADAPLVFAEWYRFVLLCVRDCRRVSFDPDPGTDDPRDAAAAVRDHDEDEK